MQKLRNICKRRALLFDKNDSREKLIARLHAAIALSKTDGRVTRRSSAPHEITQPEEPEEPEDSDDPEETPEEIPSESILMLAATAELMDTTSEAAPDPPPAPLSYIEEMGIDFESINMQKLRNICKKRALNFHKTDSREDLIARLNAAIALSKTPAGHTRATVPLEVTQHANVARGGMKPTTAPRKKAVKRKKRSSPYNFPTKRGKKARRVEPAELPSNSILMLAATAELMGTSSTPNTYPTPMSSEEARLMDAGYSYALVCEMLVERLHKARDSDAPELNERERQLIDLMASS